MAIRTIQVLGMGFGSEPASVTVTANGNQIFNGTVPTSNGPVWSLPNRDLIPDLEVLFNFEIDTSFTGLIPMTCAVNSGTVIFGSVFANYVSIPNPIFTQQQRETLFNPSTPLSTKVSIYSSVANPAFSPEEIAILENPATPPTTFNQILNQHNCNLQISSGPNTYGYITNTDCRGNVTIDGVAQTPNRDLPGTWWWTINNSSTMAYELEVNPATV